MLSSTDLKRFCRAVSCVLSSSHTNRHNQNHASRARYFASQWRDKLRQECRGRVEERRENRTGGSAEAFERTGSCSEVLQTAHRRSVPAVQGRTSRVCFLAFDKASYLHVSRGAIGMAAIGVALWKYVMRYAPHTPTYFNRDRFVLSNGMSF